MIPEEICNSGRSGCSGNQYQSNFTFQEQSAFFKDSINQIDPYELGMDHMNHSINSVQRISEDTQSNRERTPIELKRGVSQFYEKSEPRQSSSNSNSN